MHLHNACNAAVLDTLHHLQEQLISETDPGAHVTQNNAVQNLKKSSTWFQKQTWNPIGQITELSWKFGLIYSTLWPKLIICRPARRSRGISGHFQPTVSCLWPPNLYDTSVFLKLCEQLKKDTTGSKHKCNNAAGSKTCRPNTTDRLSRVVVYQKSTLCQTSVDSGQ